MGKNYNNFEVKSTGGEGGSRLQLSLASAFSAIGLPHGDFRQLLKSHRSGILLPTRDEWSSRAISGIK
ncbi:MAG: hypothetical protein Q7S43_01040 [bacterium]|nr:hypothetical protein [bacterium]